MKKKVLLILLTTMILAVTGCGNKETGEVESTEFVEAVVATEDVVTEPTEVEEPTEVVEATEAEEPTEILEAEIETEPAFTVKDMSATKYAKTNANVRSGASADYDVVGSLSTNQKVAVTGQADTGWYRIDLNGAVGYVSNSLLVDQKVAVSAPSTTTQSTGTTNTATATGDVSTSAPAQNTGDVNASVPVQNTTPSAPVQSAPSTDTSSTGQIVSNNGVVLDPNVNQQMQDQMNEAIANGDVIVFDPSTNPVDDSNGVGATIIID